jgi:hypothetical protein
MFWGPADGTAGDTESAAARADHGPRLRRCDSSSLRCSPPRAWPDQSLPFSWTTGSRSAPVRFYRADHRTTRVTAFLEIPYAALVDPAGGGAGTGYQVTVRVADSTGAVLHTESWTGTVPPSAQAGAAAVETVEFLVASGRYRLDAVARNPLTGREARATLELEGFDRPPAVSDLLLSPGIRLVSAGDTVPQPGELRRGGALVTAAAVPRLGPAHTTAHYLLEMYATGNHEEVGNITVSVRDSTGTTTLRWRRCRSGCHRVAARCMGT